MAGMGGGLLPHQTSIDEDNVGGGATPRLRGDHPGPDRADLTPLQGASPVWRVGAAGSRAAFLLELPQDDLEWENQKKVTAEERQQKGRLVSPTCGPCSRRD